MRFDPNAWKVLPLRHKLVVDGMPAFAIEVPIDIDNYSCPKAHLEKGMRKERWKHMRHVYFLSAGSYEVSCLVLYYLTLGLVGTGSSLNCCFL